LIPKGDKAGAIRALGISNLEDKLVRGVMRQVLESVYSGVRAELARVPRQHECPDIN